MSYITVEVDVDLDDFDIDDLINYIENKRYVVVKESEYKEDKVFDIKTVSDELRAEHLIRVYEQYTLEEIQNLIPLK